MMLTLQILLCIFVIGLFIFALKLWVESNKRITKNTQIEQENKQLEEKNQQLKDEYDDTFRRLQDAMAQLGMTTAQAADKIREVKENFIKLLEEAYDQKEAEFDEDVALLNAAYDEQQQKLQEEYAATQRSVDAQIEDIKRDLDDLKATRHAAMEAARREEEIKKQKEFYSLSITELDLNDIRMLERIKPSLNKPRVLSMLIWSTWFRPAMNVLMNNVLGTEKVIGIYKLTNQIDQKVYIGQSVNMRDRWVNHAKAGLGIDAPANNKLYQAMQSDGIWNFTWELLETCSAADLDAREKFYIDLYDSKNFGYNGTGGNS